MKKFDKIPFEQIISALLDIERPFPAVFLHRFSDLEPKQAKVLREAWPRVEAERRYNLIHDLDELASVETVVMFTDTADIALDDAEERTRAAAIDLLTNLEDSSHAAKLVQMLKEDPSEFVREHAAIGLGFYVYMNEMEEIDPKMGALVEDALVFAFKSKDTADVRRRCLEALGYSARNDVPVFIEGAFNSDKPEWISSALFAMGRSGMERWNEYILEALERDEPEIQLEAVRAAGELSIKEALPGLLKLATCESSQSDTLQFASIWALSQIGGEEVQETFDELARKAEETGDEDLLDFLEDAQDNLEFNQDMENDLEMLDMDLEEMARSGRMIDLEAGEDLEEDIDDDIPDNGHHSGKKHNKGH